MTARNEYRNSQMGNSQESRSGANPNENTSNRNLTDGDNRQRTVGPDSTNTAGDESNPKGSRTDLRKEEKEARDNFNHEK